MKKELRTKVIERWISDASNPTFSEDEEKTVKEDLLALMVECGAEILDKMPHPLGSYYGEQKPVVGVVDSDVGAALNSLRVGVEHMRRAIDEGPIGEEGKKQFKKDIPEFEAAIRILTRAEAKPGSTAFFFGEISKERDRQDAKWGVQRHGPLTWLGILAEEFGEVAKAVLEGDGTRYVKELVQVAAVAVATLECFYRGETALVSITELQLEVKNLRELLNTGGKPKDHDSGGS